MAKICMSELQCNILRAYDESVVMFNSRGGGQPCVASAKPKSGKTSPKNLMPEQNSAQKPNDRPSFHNL